MQKLTSLTSAFVLWVGLALSWAASPQGQPAFEFQSGDRVVLLGDTFIEREQAYGYIEARLTSHFPGRDVIFRNLGWSADTILGESRAGFDAPEKGFDYLKQHLAAVKPTVVILSHGMAGSFAGEKGVAKFKEDLNTLVDAIQAIGATKPVRLVFLSPVRHEDLGSPLPDPAAHNQQLALYSAAIQEVAARRGGYFISLFELMPKWKEIQPPQPLTDNGIHLNAYGYWRAAEAVEKGLGWSSRAGLIAIDAAGGSGKSANVQVSGLQKTGSGLRFDAAFATVPAPSIYWTNRTMPSFTPYPTAQFQGLAPGSYTLKIDGEPVASFSHAEWAQGRSIERGPMFVQAEQLRQTILKKNELYFHRWRPQNITYLFGFRKHEQGQNAREIPMFDPLVSEQETKIAELRRPKRHSFELVRAAETESLNAIAKPKQFFEPSEDSSTPPPTHSQPIPEFTVDPGFEVTLFAENPHLAKPIQMNFDAQGRLWVASSAVYPQIMPGQTANDKIIVLEDTDGDGRADKSTVFAEGLLIPTGVEPGDGGVYVGQSTELLHFKDTDGDGKADERRVVLSGFGTEDTHHILHTLRWGHDGQLYMNQSIYIHSHLETPHGVVRLDSGGILHLRPPTMEVGIFVKGFINTWGHDFDLFGQSFITDGAGGRGISWGLPGAMYETYEGARRILGSVSPGSYPKFCGLETIYSEHLPEDWQGNFITCDFRAHRVVRFAIEEQGSAYVTREMPDLLRTTNVTFRPIDVKLGPDGAIYIADWSNPIIQHGEVDFRDPRRDHEHGRIWRVTAKGRPLVKTPNLAKLSNSELFGQLASSNAFQRQKASRVLTERGSSILPDLAAWTKSQDTELGKLRALWLYQSLDVIEPALLKSVLAAKDHRVRAAGVRVLSFWQPRLENPLEALAPLVHDENPRVRVEALRALSRIPTARAAELVLSALDKPMDPFLDYAVWLSINDLAQPWIEAIQSGAWKTEGREKQLAFGLQSIEPQQASAVLGQLLQKHPISRDGSGPWINLIGTAGSERELRLLYEMTLSDRLDDNAKARALEALVQAARVRKVRPLGDLEKVAQLMDSDAEAVRVQAIRAAGSWKQRGAVSRLAAAAGGSGSPAGVRQAAFEGLREIGGGEAMEALKTLSGAERDSATRRLAVQAMAALDLSQAMPRALEVLSATKDENEALAMWRSLLANRGSVPVLVRSLAKVELPASVAKSGLRVAREGGRNEPDLILALARSGNLEEEERNLTPAEIQELASTVMAKGNAEAGEKVYRRLDLGCVSCHSIGGVGGKVGPDLTSIGASAPGDYLIESLLYPNRKVKEGYHSIRVETKDGLELSGILVRETTEQIVIRDATNKEVSVPKKDISARATSGSLMPSGLVDGLNQQEQLDLYRFLGQLGKPGPFDASKGNVARLWRLFAGTIDVAQFGDEKVLQWDLNDRAWSFSYSLVDGRVPREDLAAKLKSISYRDPSTLYAAARLQVAKEGKVGFTLSGGSYLALWVGGKQLDITSSGGEVELTAGTHTLIVKIDAQNLPEHLRVQATDGTFLTE